jgi:hypothetical protein
MAPEPVRACYPLPQEQNNPTNAPGYSFDNDSS